MAGVQLDYGPPEMVLDLNSSSSTIATTTSTTTTAITTNNDPTPDNETHIDTISTCSDIQFNRNVVEQQSLEEEQLNSEISNNYNTLTTTICLQENEMDCITTNNPIVVTNCVIGGDNISDASSGSGKRVRRRKRKRDLYNRIRDQVCVDIIISFNDRILFFYIP